MSHVPRTEIHAFAKRAVSIVVDVETELDAVDLSSVVFQFGATSKTGLTPTDTGTGVEIEVELTAADLDVTPGVYGWECRAVIATELTPVAAGLFKVAAEPTVTV